MGVRPLFRSAILAGLLIGGALLSGCGKGAQAQQQQGGPPVTVTEAIHRDVPVYDDEIGRCVAREMVAIQPQATGRITAIHFTDGANVKKGDLLFEIDKRPYQAALEQAKASFAQNKAAADLAEKDWKRVENMQQANAISKEEYEQRQNAVAVAEAQVAAAQAAIDTATVNLDYCEIHSPIDGRAGQRLVDLGNVVTANNGTILLTIQRLDPIYADFTIPESTLADVRANMSSGTLKTLVSTPEDSSQHVEPRSGDLTFLDNSVQTSTGTVKLRATLPNADSHFWPGQFVNIRLVLHIAKDAVLIPNEATQISQVGPFVYVVNDQSKAELRNIKLGQLQGDLVVVTSGLSGGEKVVTTGQLTVQPGGPVTVVPGEPAGDQGAPTSQPGQASSSSVDRAGDHS